MDGWMWGWNKKGREGKETGVGYLGNVDGVQRSGYVWDLCGWLGLGGR